VLNLQVAPHLFHGSGPQVSVGRGRSLGLWVECRKQDEYERDGVSAHTSKVTLAAPQTQCVGVAGLLPFVPLNPQAAKISESIRRGR